MLGWHLVGFLSLVGLPYTFKFLWAPLMDRFDLPWLGRRRGWLVLTQLALAGTLLLLAGTSPTGAIRSFALLACLVAFLSASQDVVVDAYRTDLLPASERGLGSSLSVLGYRLSMILSGGIALIWVDPNQGGGWDVAAGVSLHGRPHARCGGALGDSALPKVPMPDIQPTAARHDVLGFLAVLAAVAVGYLVSDRFPAAAGAPRCWARCSKARRSTPP